MDHQKTGPCSVNPLVLTAKLTYRVWLVGVCFYEYMRSYCIPLLSFGRNAGSDSSFGVPTDHPSSYAHAKKCLSVQRMNNHIQVWSLTI